MKFLLPIIATTTAWRLGDHPATCGPLLIPQSDEKGLKFYNFKASGCSAPTVDSRRRKRLAEGETTTLKPYQVESSSESDNVPPTTTSTDFTREEVVVPTEVSVASSEFIDGNYVLFFDNPCVDGWNVTYNTGFNNLVFKDQIDTPTKCKGLTYDLTYNLQDVKLNKLAGKDADLSPFKITEYDDDSFQIPGIGNRVTREPVYFQISNHSGAKGNWIIDYCRLVSLSDADNKYVFYSKDGLTDGKPEWINLKVEQDTASGNWNVIFDLFMLNINENEYVLNCPVSLCPFGVQYNHAGLASCAPETVNGAEPLHEIEQIPVDDIPKLPADDKEEFPAEDFEPIVIGSLFN